MKWGGSSKKAGEKITEIVGKVFGARGLSILLGIATFALLVGAINKWH